MEPRVFFSSHAFRVSAVEAERYYQKGMKAEGMPWETAMYPLAHLVLKEGIEKCPLELAELDEIACIVIPRVAIPPDIFKAHSCHAAKHGGVPVEEMNTTFQRQCLDILLRFPHLGMFVKQHSHHTLELTRPSEGDMQHNILNAYAWYRSKGLNTMFSMIMTRHAMMPKWFIHAHALGKENQNVELGQVTVIADNHPLCMDARKKPYYDTQEGAEWCDRNKAALRAAGFQISRQFLPRGYRRYIISYEKESVVMVLPPDFPLKPVRVFRIIDAQKNMFAPLPLPGQWQQQNAFSRLGMLELARHYQSLLCEHGG
ncbi:hypothetical protein HY491_03905 [Candidatus Woesearchaeota archaeon]|nr:hypothetical protein [Candidatus Woesearchaeota archaeon]